MKKKYLKEFVSLFRCLSYAGWILNGEYKDNPEALNKMLIYIDDTHKIVIESKRSNLIFNLLDEIEKNFYKYENSREFYIKDILRKFIDIIPYLDIETERDLIDDEDFSFTVGNTSYSKSHGKR